MGKYAPLQQWLLVRGHRGELILHFDEIEAVIGGPLPASARKHPAWWANEQDGRHVQASAWMTSGFLVDGLDQANGWVRFRQQS